MILPFPEVLSPQQSLAELEKIIGSTDALKQLVDVVQQPVLVKDAQHRMVLVNRAMCELLGRQEHELLGRTAFDLHPFEEAVVFYSKDVGVFQTGLPSENEEILTDAGGMVRTIVTRKRLMYAGHDEQTPFLVCVITDITSYRAEEARSRFLSLHDPLTGLPNRTFFNERLTAAVEAARHTDETLALLLVDVDGFKCVNDLHGHPAGDELLRVIAERMLSVITPTDTLARLGGDEFAIILQGGDQRRRTRSVAEAIATMLSHRIPLDFPIFVSVSIGIAIFEGAVDGQDGVQGREGVHGQEALMHQADVALYSVKRCGKAGYRHFDAELERSGSQRLERDLRLALSAGELRLAFQPVRQADDGVLTGHEALLRWHHPIFGIIVPDVFIPIAERTGLIEGFGAFVLDEACKRAALSNDETRMAVNISPLHMIGDHLVDAVRGALNRSGLAPQRLEIEITESLLTNQIERAHSVIAALRNLGVRIAIDDFGAGTASLDILMRVDADRIKIDRRLIAPLPHDRRAAIIVGAVARMAKDMGAAVTAEGVEDITQLEALRAMDIDEVQGYLTGRPDEALSTIQQWHADGELAAMALAMRGNNEMPKMKRRA